MEENQLAVRVANGDSLPRQGLCRVVPLEVHQLHFKVQLYVLTLGM